MRKKMSQKLAKKIRKEIRRQISKEDKDNYLGILAGRLREAEEARDEVLSKLKFIENQLAKQQEQFVEEMPEILNE